MKSKRMLPSLALLCASALTGAVSADQIETTSGDHFTGKVLSVTNDMVLLQSDVLGQVTIPKSKVSSIKMGSAGRAATGSQSVNPGAAYPSTLTTQNTISSTNASAVVTTDLGRAIKQLDSDPNAVKKVQEQYLAGTDASTKAKFNELLSGLQTGQIKVSDLRAQAQSAVDQLNSYKKELGPEAGEALNSYLSVLESFLRESGNPSSTVTNALNR
jgi:hypothetical protein